MTDAAWTAPHPDPVDGPLTGPDRPMLEGYLGWQRSTLLNICAGLTGEQLASRPIASTSLSLLGLVRHLAKVERTWFRQRAADDGVEPMFPADLGVDADFRLTAAASAAAELQRLRDEWAACDAAVASVPFDHEIETRDGTMALRFVYVHVIAEYARHNGHADLLREAIDGVTGR